MTETTAAPQGSQPQRTRPPGSASPRLQERLEREARARRSLFVAAVAGLAGTLGIVAVSAGTPPAVAITKPAVASETLSPRVVAEVPIQATGNQDVPTIVRFVTPAQEAPPAHVRTRATP